MKPATAKHSKDYLRDTLDKLQAMQNGKNSALQVYLQGRLFLLFYTATAVHEIVRRTMNGTWRNFPDHTSSFLDLLGDSPT